MLEKIALHIFLTAAFLCGSTLLVMLWWGPGEALLDRIPLTLFIVGFFAFLVWATKVVYKFLLVLEKT